jgi:hypothetical protein
VDPRAVMDAVVKRKISSPRRESNPRTLIVQPLAQCYTLYDSLFPVTPHPGRFVSFYGSVGSKLSLREGISVLVLESKIFPGPPPPNPFPNWNSHAPP